MCWSYFKYGKELENLEMGLKLVLYLLLKAKVKESKMKNES